MRLTKKLIFSIEAVIDIAFYGDAAPVQSQKLRQDGKSHRVTLSKFCSILPAPKSLKATVARAAVTSWRGDVRIFPLVKLPVLSSKWKVVKRRNLTTEVLNWVKRSYTRYGKTWKNR